MKSGFIYVLSNEYYQKNLYKIGKTTRSVNVRLNELSADTGVPQKFEVEFAEWVRDVHRAEVVIHEELDKYRIGNKEFFNIPLVKAKRIIRKVCDAINSDIVYEQSTESEIYNILSLISSDAVEEKQKLYSRLVLLKDETENLKLKTLCSYYLGDYYLTVCLYDAALNELNVVGKQKDKLELYGIDNNQFWLHKTDCYVGLRKYRQAAYCLQFIDDSYIGSFKRAELYLKLGELDKAINIYNQLATRKNVYFETLIKDRLSILEMLKRNNHFYK